MQASRSAGKPAAGSGKSAAGKSGSKSAAGGGGKPPKGGSRKGKGGAGPYGPNGKKKKKGGCQAPPLFMLKINQVSRSTTSPYFSRLSLINALIASAVGIAAEQLWAETSMEAEAVAYSSASGMLLPRSRE